MTMIEQHELALAILAWIGILALPATYAALFIAVVLSDRAEAAIADRKPKGGNEVPSRSALERLKQSERTGA